MNFPTPDPIQTAKYYKMLSDYLKEINLDQTMEIQKQARKNPDLYKYIAYQFRNYPILTDKGLEFPVIVYRAPIEQRYDLESVLHIPLNTDSIEVIDPTIIRLGENYFNVIASTNGELRDDPTYRMIELKIEGELKLKCGIGGYVNMLKTCDVFESELLIQFGRCHRREKLLESLGKRTRPDEKDLSSSLILRNHLQRSGDENKCDPIMHELGRSVGLAISTLIIFIEDGQYKALVRQRSERVKVHPNLLHVMPAGMFQSCTRQFHQEYRITHNIYREYLEEIYDKKELRQDSGIYGFDHFYEDPNLLYLRDLVKQNAANFYFTGIAINLLNLRPEICTLIMIHDPDWIINQRRGRKVGGLQLDVMKINYEYSYGEGIRGSKFEKLASMELGKFLEIPSEWFKPEYFVPPGAAALHLGLEVAREELNICY